MNDFSDVRFKSFKFQGVTVHPPSAYTTRSGYKSHLRKVAGNLGKLYISCLNEFKDHFRYTLYNLRNELLPSVKLATILLKIKKSEIRKQ